MKIVRVKISAKESAKIRKGYPLILKKAVQNPEVLQEEGAILHLMDPQNNFVATGYHGVQNKGIGWILSQKKVETIDFHFFEAKIGAALAKRKPFLKNPNTTAFRLFNGEGDGIGGLTIDYYDGYYLINWYSQGIYALKQHVYNVFDKRIQYKGIYEKKRFDAKGKYIEQDSFVRGTPAEFPLIIKENGIQYAVNLNDGAMTGIFLDQREVRQALRNRYALGQTILNTFSYTGAFSVAAVRGGAVKTISVDLASRSLPKTKEQFHLNGIDPEHQEIRVMDVSDYLRYARRHQLKFGVVVLDPPSFARSKKHTFSVVKDYPKLLMEAIGVTEKGGFIFVSTNNASLSIKRLKGFIEEAFRTSEVAYKIREEFSLPKDFPTNRQYPESDYLKVVIVQRK